MDGDLKDSRKWARVVAYFYTGIYGMAVLGSFVLFISTIIVSTYVMAKGDQLDRDVVEFLTVDFDGVVVWMNESSKVKLSLVFLWVLTVGALLMALPQFYCALDLLQSTEKNVDTFKALRLAEGFQNLQIFFVSVDCVMLIMHSYLTALMEIQFLDFYCILSGLAIRLLVIYVVQDYSSELRLSIPLANHGTGKQTKNVDLY